ncbi:redoxin family protein [Sphingobacterium faecium]|nr:redoxin family protein [Sphingobacterium faecium]
MGVFRLLLLLLLLPSSFVWGQEHVRLNIHLEGIDGGRLKIYFDDGLVNNLINVKEEDPSILLEKTTYTPYPRISFSYDGSYYQYFINRLLTTINIYYDEYRVDFPFYTDHNKDITPIYDTASNVIFRNLREDQKTEGLKLNELFTKHGSEMQTNDSVKYALNQVTKAMNAKSMAILSSYPDDFFSFLYFKDQVLGPTLFIEDDPEYYTDLLVYYNSTFPAEFRTTIEGKKIVQDLERKITPVLIKENEPMPDIYFKDIYGDTIFFKNQPEGFVLLDFWASWCSPCLEQIPDLRLLRENFSEDRLKIIGISIDRDSVSFINSIKENKMEWIHSFDRGGVLSSALGFNNIPRIVLLDRNGHIVYYKKGGRLDMQKINAILRKD